MRVISFLLFVFVISGPGNRAFGQLTHSFTVSGRVVAERDTNLAIVNAIVRFNADNGYMFQTNSDSAGHYEFRIKKANFKQFELRILADRETGSGKKNEPFIYLTSVERRVFNTADSLERYTVDFKLKRSSKGCYFPAILFKRNSLDHYYETWQDTIELGFYPDFDYAISMISQTIKENPTMVVEIAGHCSLDEKNPKELSQKRAEQVKQELVKLGVAPQRIIAKGYGIEKNIVKPGTIASARSEADKEKLKARNRRCAFKIVSWDYKTE
ncbi:MAG: OmpA family protein [Bacteroidetes bacterium]|nr:OmpA family protein [Bacteroidota bacterium]